MFSSILTFLLLFLKIPILISSCFIHLLEEMGIRGLWTYIESSGGNLSVYELHNQPLVIDAENFATACYREAALRCEFGGEYLAFKSYVQSLLKEFSICGVEPIFVFGGCHPKEGTKLNTLMKRNKEYFKQLSSALLIAKSTCSTELDIDIAPRLNRNVLVEILRESSIRYIACEREADISTAELAVHLQCLVTSGDSDFFIYRPNDNNQVYNFIPFSTISRYSKKRSVPCSICKRSGASCYFMSCSILNNSGPFSKLKYPMLPLFAILVGNDMISNIRLPTIIDSLIHTSKLQRKSYYQRRIDAIFNWLLSFRDIEEPLSLVLSLYSENERDGIGKTIRLGISDYVLSSSGENLARELGFSTEHNISSSVSLSSKMGNLSIQDPTTCRGSYCEDASKFSKPILERNDDDDEDSIFHRWPKELIRRFRFLDLIPSLFDHMYVRNGAFSRLLMEDIKIPSSLDECMSKMRSAINGLIYGLENHLGTNGKLCGMENECVTEYRRNVDGDFTKTLMSMKPLKPPSAETPELSFLSFFSKLFNVNLEKDFKPLEIQALAILLILWFRCSSHAQNEAKNIKTSPVALALSCCTIAMNSNREFLGRNRDVDGDFANSIRTHLDKCADVAKSNCCQEVNKRSFCIEQVHQLNELQSMATGLKHLVAMIEVLCPFYMSNSNKFDSCSHFRNPFISFYPFWMLFASGRLLYWISRLLQNIDPSERFHKVMNEWLPKLLIRTNTGREQEDCASKDLTKLFNLIDKLNS
ncbi:Protein asteroid 1, variant 2 [Schistosoma haematobium]|uniref:Protein asteroid 1, variant 2 n=1 Tax=Schistosoma haematobium TaxID=6185 RepID=A0A922LLX8_SCHHA|nr:Protein asteroid 1, variant 2 [Schistosoma haematobium]KAH9589546.1 Protein asteroid 1, variant 2 [Schistosoma haematobium]